jgi:hypothetical protein
MANQLFPINIDSEGIAVVFPLTRQSNVIGIFGLNRIFCEILLAKLTYVRTKVKKLFAEKTYQVILYVRNSAVAQILSCDHLSSTQVVTQEYSFARSANYSEQIINNTWIGVTTFRSTVNHVIEISETGRSRKSYS